MLLPRTTGETVASDLDWFFRRDGSMFPVSYVSAPIEMPGGRGAVVAFSDIEERFRSEELLRERVATLAARAGGAAAGGHARRTGCHAGGGVRGGGRRGGAGARPAARGDVALRARRNGDRDRSRR